MADKHEMEIIITPTGETKVHIKGIKGKKCVDEINALKVALGEVKEQKLTSEYYEPEPKVGITQKTSR